MGTMAMMEAALMCTGTLSRHTARGTAPGRTAAARALRTGPPDVVPVPARALHTGPPDVAPVPVPALPAAIALALLAVTTETEAAHDLPRNRRGTHPLLLLLLLPLTRTTPLC